MHIFSDYSRKEHGLSGIDARVKLVFSMILLCMVLSYKGFIFPAIVVSSCLIGCIYIKVSLKVFLLRFTEPVFIIIMLVLLKFLFSGNDVMFSVNVLGVNITGHADGLKEGLANACRILGAVSVLAMLGFTTSFVELMSALSWLRVPKGLIEVLMFAYRYIFVIYEDAQVIYNAQKNRLGYSTPVKGLNSFGTLAGSLVLKAFDRSHALTISMTQRGYDGNIPMLRHKPFRLSEVAAGLLIICMIGVAWKVL